MKTIKFATKLGRELTYKYKSAQFTQLYQVYNTCSLAKRKAECLSRGKMRDENGSDFRIMSWNTFSFTCGWTLPNGEIRVETKSNSYMIIEQPF